MQAVRPVDLPRPGAAPTAEALTLPNRTRPALAGMIASLPRRPAPAPAPDDEVIATAAARPGGLSSLPPDDRRRVDDIAERLRSLNRDAAAGLAPLDRPRSPVRSR